MRCYEQSKVPVGVEWLNPRDAVQVSDLMALDRIIHLSSPREGRFLDMFRHDRLICVGMLGDIVAGFMVFDAVENGRRILQIAVHPDVRRWSLGSMMLDHLKRHVSPFRHVTELVAQVAESNLVAQQFFRANGFLWTETIKRGSRESVYVMKCMKHAKSTTSESVAQGYGDHFKEVCPRSCPNCGKAIPCGADSSADRDDRDSSSREREHGD